MNRDKMQDEIIELISTMVAELKAADSYLDMTECWEDDGNKKIFIAFAKTELLHYNGVKNIYEDGKSRKYSDFNLDNPALEYLMGTLHDWCKSMQDKIVRKEQELGM